jgi:predicted nucleotidyltransferase
MTRLTLDQQALAQLCHRHSIRRLSLFGSALRGPHDRIAMSISSGSSSEERCPG